jgi:autophagy-related protein 101
VTTEQQTTTTKQQQRKQQQKLRMNCKEYNLPELELSTGQVREALKCILHTILFVRAPGNVTPRDTDCEGFNLLYTRIAPGTNNTSTTGSGTTNNVTSTSTGKQQQQQQTTTSKSSSTPSSSSSSLYDVDVKVDDAIESFLRTLSQIGPELLSGCLTLNFFERRTNSQLFGLVSHEERVVYVFAVYLFYILICCHVFFFFFPILSYENNFFFFFFSSFFFF